MLAAQWLGVLDWEHADSVAGSLFFLSLYALGTTFVLGLRDVRRDLEMLRRRTKVTFESTQRAATRVEEVRKEVFLGPLAHLPGQIGKLEGWLHAQEATPAGHRGGLPPTPQTEFDAVFLINLAADREKLAHTRAMLEKHGIEANRFEAVDGLAAEFDDEWAQYSSRSADLPPERYTGQPLIESRGAWGYLKTMHALLSHAKEHKLNRILILEDDIMLDRRFSERFAQIWPRLPHDWRLVYLGSAQVDRSKMGSVSDDLYHPGGMANGSYAIALDGGVIDQALASIERFDWPFDAGALREIDAAYPDKVFAVDPPLVLADVSSSSIRPGRDLATHASKHGWNLADYEAPFSGDVVSDT